MKLSHSNWSIMKLSHSNWNDLSVYDDGSLDFTNYYSFNEGFSKDECEKIISVGHKLNTEQGTAGGGVNESIRRSKISWLPLNSDTRWVYDRIGEMAQQANAAIYQMDLVAQTEMIQFGTYDAQDEGHYAWHVDHGKGLYHRKLSVCVQLTEPTEYEGGQLQMLSGTSEVTMPSTIGSVAVFPSFMLHRVLPVTEGKRQSLVNWISGPPLR